MYLKEEIIFFQKIIKIFLSKSIKKLKEVQISKCLLIKSPYGKSN